MFIQVLTTDDEYVILNSDFIRAIECPKSGHAYALIYVQGADDVCEVSKDEFERIAPLLTNKPAPMPSTMPADVVDAYHHWHEMSDAFEFSKLTDSLRDLIRTLAKHIPAQETGNDN